MPPNRSPRTMPPPCSWMIAGPLPVCPSRAKTVTSIGSPWWPGIVWSVRVRGRPARISSIDTAGGASRIGWIISGVSVTGMRVCKASRATDSSGSNGGRATGTVTSTARGSG